ncbi:hypothetical protein AAC387_Pa12g0383 [Persea americana]
MPAAARRASCLLISFIHLPNKHQSKHLEIAQERPERMAKRGGDVVFHEEVIVPSETVAQDGSKEDEPPIEKEEEAN